MMLVNRNDRSNKKKRSKDYEIVSMMLVNRNDRSNKIKRSKDYEIVS
jgi:hypothetical protein